MPNRFRIEFTHRGEDEVRSVEVELDGGDDFFLHLNRWERQYYQDQSSQLVDIKRVVALVDMPEFGILEGDVVWGDWLDREVAALN